LGAKPDDPTNPLNDEYNVLTYEDGDGLYSCMSFTEVTNDGQTGVLSSICEGVLGGGDFSGYDEGTDTIVGSWVLNFSGPWLSEQFAFTGLPPGSPTNPFLTGPLSPGLGLPGDYLYASGGDYIGPVLDNNGDPIPGQIMALGGTLGPGSAMLWPNSSGGIYQGVSMDFKLDSVFSDGTAGSEVEVALTEDLDIQGTWSDNTPPSFGLGVEPNPDGTPAASGNGAVILTQTLAADYSRYGPWAGLGSLTPDPDRGLFVFGSTISDGTTVALLNNDTALNITWVARTVPSLANEFAISPQPHIDLAALINADPVASTFVRATVGTNVAGELQVLIAAIDPVESGNSLYITTTDAASIRISGTLYLGVNAGLLTAGAKITQSSLVAGGTSTIRDGVHDPLLGIVLAGGAVLPPGRTTTFVVEAPS
jgi:hypothetical protein